MTELDYTQEINNYIGKNIFLCIFSISFFTLICFFIKYSIPKKIETPIFFVYVCIWTLIAIYLWKRKVIKNQDLTEAKKITNVLNLSRLWYEHLPPTEKIKLYELNRIKVTDVKNG